MGDNSKIEWTEATWNPIVGCSVVSPGCTNCYAMKWAGWRMEDNPRTPHYRGTTQKSKGGHVWTGKVALASHDTITAPIRWKRPRRIFVNSMGDLFHESVPDDWIDKVFAVMALSPQHTFQMLTKRAERMREYCSLPDRMFRIAATSQEWPTFQDAIQHIPIFERTISGKFFPNVWLGVSAEDQQRADERIPALLETPAAIRFVSAEPLLGEIDLRGYIPVVWSHGAQRWCHPDDFHAFECTLSEPAGDDEENQLPSLDWIIAGGESGPGARPMHPAWPRLIRNQCKAAGVPFFFKQWGEWLPWEPEHGPCWKAQNGRSEDSHVLFPTDFDNAHNWDDGLSYIAQGVSQAAFQRVGKVRSGRLLDGSEWNGTPEEDSR